MKKVLSLVLAVVLVLGMSATAFGALNIDAKDFKNDNLYLSPLGHSDGKEINNPDKAGYYRPEDKLKFEIMYATGGFDANGNPIGEVRLDRDDVRKYKIGVQLRATEGSSIIDSYKVKYDGGANLNANAFVEVKFVDVFVSTKEQDFNLLVYLTADKSRVRESELNFPGVFANEETEVYENEDHVYLGDAHVVEALDYIRDIEVELGQGFSIFAKMFDGKKYYGHVSQEIKAEDEPVLAQYPDIDTIYYVQTIGLASTGEVVQFDLENNYYVYAQDEDGNLVYIGRSNDRLAYYTKYFLSVKELDVDVEIDDGDILVPGEEIEEVPEGLGGDGETPANVNDNPSTGR